MKILISIGTLEVGGAQTFAIRLANALKNSATVYFYIQDTRNISSDFLNLLDKNITVLYFNPNAFFDWIAWKVNRILTVFNPKISVHKYLNVVYFRNQLRKLKPDVINSHMLGSDLLVAANKGNIPLVISMHGCYETALLHDAGFIGTAESIFAVAKSVVYPADKNIEHFRSGPRFSQIRKRKIYYGIPDFSHRRSIDNDKKLTYGMVARSIPSKGWEFALEAFDRLCERHFDLELEFLVLCDDSIYFQELKKKHTNRRINFIGFSAAPQDYIELMDVCLLPTRFPGESLPNSVIEYLRSGKPVISTNIGEIPEMINVNGKLAGLIIPLDLLSTSEVMKAMETYLYQRSIIAMHSEVAREAFKKFMMDKCVEQYLDVFREAKKEVN